MESFLKWDVKLQRTAKIIGALVIIIPVALLVGKKTSEYIIFFRDALEMKQEVREMRNAFYILNGVVSSNMFKTDTLEYQAMWHGELVDVALRMTLREDMFVFIPDIHTGERAFSVSINNDREEYYFIDFDGQYVPLIIVE